MRRPTFRTVVGLTLGGLLLSGCTGAVEASGIPSTTAPSVLALPRVDAVADAAALDTVSLTAEPGKPPVLDFAPPVSVTGPIARVVAPGSGETIDVNQAVVANVVTIDGGDGTEQGSTYDGAPQILMTTEASMPLALLEQLVGAQTGVRVLLAGPVGEGRTTLWVFEVTSVLDVLAQAEGTEVKDLAPGLPPIGYADSPTTEAVMPMLVPAEGPPPEDLVVQPLIVGTGPEVSADSSLVLQVVGSLWDGTQFQNSWEDGAGLPVVLAGTIRGWREGLVGQPIGSRVMLVVPPDLAWGDKGRGELIPGGSTLVYVIDILAGI
ncbi:FKBP-type peptidyl-prolyl cis-trans isomerase [Streptosporangium sp. NPDC087985]|uniref:FKBP-type peptidyl-prolyl cis-trans isomerase n=1 Tax=Streptosporangium sp. NPDC087985 TaxID=3366196 RepID=UPI00380EFB0C